MVVQPWQVALEAQLAALSSVKKLLAFDRPDLAELQSSWRVDDALLRTAEPYAWSDEVTSAVLQASRSIPLDTDLNQWNLQTSHAAFWHFQTPLPFKTTHLDEGVRSLVFGWIRTQQRDFGMPVCSWIDDPLDRWTIIPSQTFEWANGDTLGGMLEATRGFHKMNYGPGGKWEHTDKIGLDAFMAATEGLARFMLAALAWLDQKIIVTDGGHIERHRRKAFNRETKQSLEKIRVVQLRKTIYPEREHGESEVEWTCRWAVSGHWRNTPCGPGKKDRQLRYIMPFIKGPADKPFRATKKVYEVRR